MILIATLPIATATMIKAQTTLSAPSVQVPNSNWLFQDSTKYPNAPSEYDPAGGGMLSYVDNTNYDTVKIWYEKAQVSSYTSQQLENEAVRIFNRDDASDTRSLDSSGTKTYANVAAGFAKGLDSSTGMYTTEIVFIKGIYYFNVYCLYNSTSASQNNIDLVVNSITVGQLSTSVLPTPTTTSPNSTPSVPEFPSVTILAFLSASLLATTVLIMRKRKLQ